jgi:hypothetical protein
LCLGEGEEHTVVVAVKVAVLVCVVVTVGVVTICERTSGSVRCAGARGLLIIGLSSYYTGRHDGVDKGHGGIDSGHVGDGWIHGLRGSLGDCLCDGRVYLRAGRADELHCALGNELGRIFVGTFHHSSGGSIDIGRDSYCGGARRKGA